MPGRCLSCQRVSIVLPAAVMFSSSSSSSSSSSHFLSSAEFTVCRIFQALSWFGTEHTWEYNTWTTVRAGNSSVQHSFIPHGETEGRERPNSQLWFRRKLYRPILPAVGLHGVSSSYSSVVPDVEREQRIVPALRSPVMSRRSLRLHTAAPFRDEGLLDRSLPGCSASFSAGDAGRRNASLSSRSVKSHRSQQHSVSCSQSLLLQTPRKQTTHPRHNSSLHSAASDASLLSSMLDESSIQERTLIDGFWGLDQDVDPKESTIIAEHSAILANSTLIGQGDDLCLSHAGERASRSCAVNGYYCRDCDPHRVRREAPTTCYPSSKYTSSSSKYTSSPSAGPGDPGDPGDPGPSTIYCRDKSRRTRTAHSSYCGVMNLKEARANKKQLSLNGSLWEAVGDAFRWLGRRWHHMVGSLGWFLPNLLRLLLLLLPLLLLLSLCWWGPAALLSVLPAVNMTEWRTALPLSGLPLLSSLLPLTSTQSGAGESREVQTYTEPPYSPLLAETPQGGQEEEEVPAAAAADSARLLQLERSLSGLWERVEAGGRRAEQRHGELLQMYRDLQQQLALPQSPDDHDHDDAEAAEPRLSGLLEHRLTQLRARLDRERLQWHRTQERFVEQQQTQASRLADVELLLQTLAAKTEEVQRRQEAATAAARSATTLPAAVSVGVDRESHDALLAEVGRLEAALGSVRQDLQGLMGCQNRCDGLDSIQKTISAQVLAQVREELRALFYGNQLTTGGEASGDPAALPDSLLQWLSERYVSAADLQASLASLELSILQNVSRQLQQGAERAACEETVRQSVLHAAQDAGAAVTQQDVHQIVQNALRLFSQDRTGMADYALETGGGSILSTRCSETYETKTALMSLFGIPLWYFSQSPRAVIQPDVHPGNCWAFRGSRGYLVIRLSMKILPTAFSLEHIPKALAPSGALRSAPRDFTVYGLDDENQENGKLLGSYAYQEDGEPLQTFSVSEENDRAYQVIEVQVLSNWGHQVYTCMYRFRVHGQPTED